MPLCTIHQLTDHTYKCRPGSICTPLHDSPTDRPHIQLSSRQHLRPSARMTNWQTAHTSVFHRDRGAGRGVSKKKVLVPPPPPNIESLMCPPISKLLPWCLFQAAFAAVCTNEQLTDGTDNCLAGSILRPSAWMSN